jgi:sensor histidine kinase YesM
MKAKLPIRSLILMNCLQAGTIGAFLLLFTYLYGKPGEPIIRNSLTTIFEILSVGFINILVLKMFFKSGFDSSSRKKRIRWYIFGSLGSCLFFAIPSGHIRIVYDVHMEDYNVWPLVEIVARGLCCNAIIVFGYNFILLQHEKSKADLENSQLKTANMEAANLLLKQQVQPHFLFNALSILKTLYKKDLHAGEAYLVHLANFLRASVSYSNTNVIRLSEEINFCKTYLEMQRLRFGDALNCDIDIPERMLMNGFVPSFSIQPLLENALKHNEVTDEFPLSIKVYQEGDYIIVRNNLQLKENGEASSGKGLTNLIERYRILSGDEVMIQSDDKTFSVGIKILKS